MRLSFSSWASRSASAKKVPACVVCPRSQWMAPEQVERAHAAVPIAAAAELPQRLVGKRRPHPQIAQPSGGSCHQQLDFGTTALGLGTELSIPVQGLLEPPLPQEIAERRGAGH